MGGNSRAIVLPVAGKPTEIARKTLVYNDYCMGGSDGSAIKFEYLLGVV
jgi:hypothetical protein